MYYRDLSSYRYERDAELPHVKNVGWLAGEHEFPQGEVSAVILEKLRQWIVRFPVNQMRGYHYCEFCQVEDVVVANGNGRRTLGSAEVWIPAPQEGRYYASPNLILHYIEVHRYLPPDEYLKALEEAKMP